MPHNESVPDLIQGRGTNSWELAYIGASPVPLSTDPEIDVTNLPLKGSSTPVERGGVFFDGLLLRLFFVRLDSPPLSLSKPKKIPSGQFRDWGLH